MSIEIPGRRVESNCPQELYLKSNVARLCLLTNERFPGSQPVSFLSRDLDKLEKDDYWVCEKSDGVRVLLFICSNGDGTQDAYLIDRHNEYYMLSGLFLPHYADMKRPLGNTIVDGELVNDKDPQTGQTTLRYLAFDCLVADEQNIMNKTLDKRYGRLSEWLYRPYSKMIQEHPHMRAGLPFEIKVKQIKSSYNAEQVFTVDIPALHHESDGLIYTCVNAPYSPGTDTNIMKWKPASENSIDFKLELRFPPLANNPSKPDFYAKPVFVLHQWNGGDRYERYDTMYVEDDEWERLKESGEQLDDRVVEVRWDGSVPGWRMMRFRDDKPHGNHRNTVEAVLESIQDGVEKDVLLARGNAIRNAWKARMAQPKPPPPPPPKKIGDLKVLLKYGPLQTSPWSRVAGPDVVFGMTR
ncbi:hypothetical protein CYLTODRAFT_438709 [Cylindrobasidium torrendii FP15055 ss-10]|uniref:mRNA-capping enzyme subunit alpha n=1 Tax=Cylindrobasidium torrendii FP15055 ss-10 TaxID=1314674 RepID=A0A0D7AXF0_9AGAR|nr:hypothetical protein CYLTODRAFT_438709 [Cylindrobasidium torrendii FP15055 ss-10]